MKHEVKIRIRKGQAESYVIQDKSFTLRKKLMDFLFGKNVKLMVLIPRESVERVTIVDLDETGDEYVKT